MEQGCGSVSLLEDRCKKNDVKLCTYILVQRSYPKLGQNIETLARVRTKWNQTLTSAMLRKVISSLCEATDSSETTVSGRLPLRPLWFRYYCLEMPVEWSCTQSFVDSRIISQILYSAYILILVDTLFYLFGGFWHPSISETNLENSGEGCGMPRTEGRLSLKHWHAMLHW